MTEATKNKEWHTLEVDEIYKQLDTRKHGLSAAEASQRLAQHGPNELQAAHRVSPWELLAEQFKNVLIIILLVAAVFSAFVGEELDAIVIGIIVLFAVVLGFVQEYRAERAIEALREMAAPTAAVMRDGDELEIPAREVVPGDVILIRAGDKIPADSRLIESVNLQIEEAALTGESVPVEKRVAALDKPDLAIGDRKNLAYAGTVATYGRGRAVVTATGMNTEFGKIAKLLQTVETGQTPLQDNLDKVGHNLARAAFVIVAIIVAIGLFRGQPLIEMLLFGIALAVETLGSTSVICSDKTGTLTKDEMTARKIFAAGEVYEVSGAGYEPHGQFSLAGKEVAPSEAVKQLLTGATLASDAHIVQHETDKRWHVKGDPTEGALVVAAAKAGLKKNDLDTQYPRVEEIPFTSETKRMTTLHNADGQHVAYSKGAPEIIIDSCTKQLTANGEVAFDTAAKKKVLDAAQGMAEEALRVLAVAMKKNTGIETAEHEMTFLGLLGMIDPPRPEAKDAIKTCEAAGIKVVMITGDHPVTAQAVARELGLLKNGRVITGAELDDISDEDFVHEVEKIEVYARVSPAHKLRVVAALQANKHIVAMTGDGVNDAPALKKADIGIAMGITGTDVTKEASAMTLTDDNFASIVAAVEEGRSIFGNIKKYLMYLLSSNIGEIGLMTGATLLGMPMPLLAVQILYVNLATDGLPALALAVDPPEEDLMQRKPRDPRTGIFTRPVIILMLVGGIWSTIINLGLFWWADHSGRPHAEAVTMTFVSLVLIQFFKAYNFRSDRLSVMVKPFANKWLNIAILWELALLTLIVYLPALHEPFGTYSLPLNDLLIIAGLAFTVVPVLEIAKWMERKGWFGSMA